MDSHNRCSQIAASATDGNILVWSTTDNKVGIFHIKTTFLDTLEVNLLEVKS